MRSSQSAFVSTVGRVALRKCPSASVSVNTRRAFWGSFLARRNHLGACPHRVGEDNDSLVREVGYRRARTVPTAGSKQQEVQWNDVRVIGVSRPCQAHTLLTVNVGVTYETGSMCDSYRVPGMFVQLRPSFDVSPAFVAISSPPTITGIFEFLIKDSDSTAWVSSLKEDDVIHSSPVMGKGFPIASLFPPPPDVLLFATGSGIAPIRAAIESVLNGVSPRKRRSVTLYYGARTFERMPYTDRFEDWKKIGVDVVPVLSRPEDSSTTWDGRTGYVQHALDDIGINDPENTAALLCGVRGMTEDVRQRLIAMGVSNGNILLNF